MKCLNSAALGKSKFCCFLVFFILMLSMFNMYIAKFPLLSLVYSLKIKIMDINIIFCVCRLFYTSLIWISFIFMVI